MSSFMSMVIFTALTGASLRAQDDDSGPKQEQHGRKYKAPPDTSHVEVTVLKGFNKKPIDGAHVVFRPVKDGKDEGNLEVKTHQDGKVSIDVIPTGSNVRIQVIADGFATFAQQYQVNEATRAITIEMIRPRAQVSTYVDNTDKPAQIQPGLQVPIRAKKTAPPASSTPGTSPSNASSPATPPADPNAGSGKAQ